MKKSYLIIGVLFVSIIALSFTVKTTDETKAQTETKVKNEKKVKILTDESFGTTINSGITVVDFWATWCAPCRIQGPIMDDVADEVGNGVTIAKLDVDNNRRVAAQYQIRSIPTIMIFKNGKMVKKFVGIQSKEILKKEIEALK